MTQKDFELIVLLRDKGVPVRTVSEITGYAPQSVQKWSGEKTWEAHVEANKRWAEQQRLKLVEKKNGTNELVGSPKEEIIEVRELNPQEVMSKLNEVIDTLAKIETQLSKKRGLII